MFPKYVNFTADSLPVAKAEELADGASSDLDIISSVYNYIITHFTYDYSKASSVTSGYLPDIDEVFTSEKGICFDYAAVMTAMLRSQGIPTKLITGYVSSGGSELYHAWNMIWLEESGWITVEIRAPRHEWQRIDLTFAAAGQSALVGDGKGYADKEVY